MEYKVFYLNYKNNEEIPSSSPKTMTKENILEKIEILNEHNDNFLGIIDSNNVTLQFRVDTESRIWAEIPIPEKKGSYGAKIEYHEVVTILKDLDGYIDKNSYSNFEFTSWIKSKNSVENETSSEIAKEKKWWQFWK